MTLTLLPPADLADEPSEPTPGQAPRSTFTSPRPGLLLAALTLLALVAYVAAAVWLQDDQGFAIGDALAKTAEAKYVVLSRDAHAAALGFYWMPIPTVSQVPLVLLMQPFGLPELAGPLSTALWGAATVWVLGRTGLDLGLSRWLTALLVAAYAFNPVVIYYAGNGMGEGALFFFLALMLRGCLRYVSTPSTASLVLAGAGLAGAALSRYEAVLLVPVVPLLLAAYDVRRGAKDRALSTCAMSALPAIWAVGLWVGYMRVIGGSFTAFRTEADTTVGVAPGAPAGPAFQPDYYAGATGSIGNALAWTGDWLVAYSPVLLLLPLLLLPLGRKALGTLTIAATVALLPAVTVYLLVGAGTTGEPRYFSAFVVVGAVTALWTVARLRSVPLLRWVAPPVALALLVLGAGTGAVALTDADATRNNSEFKVFGPLTGRGAGATVTSAGEGGLLPPWRAFTDRMDATLRPGANVLADTRYSFPAALLSDNTGRFVMNSDRDYEAQVAPTGVQRFDYAIVPVSGSRGGLADAFDDAGRVVREAPPGTWREVFTTPSAATLYERVVPAGKVGVRSG